jgi:hypothetical protein
MTDSAGLITDPLQTPARIASRLYLAIGGGTSFSSREGGSPTSWYKEERITPEWNLCSNKNCCRVHKVKTTTSFGTLARVSCRCV